MLKIQTLEQGPAPAPAGEIHHQGSSAKIWVLQLTPFGGGVTKPENWFVPQITPGAVATGTIGCIAQIASGTSIPVLHTIELLDFAHGGPTPDGLASLAG